MAVKGVGVILILITSNKRCRDKKVSEELLFNQLDKLKKFNPSYTFSLVS
jgi:hypothetical protein